MSKHDSNTNGRGRRSPPPVPAVGSNGVVKRAPPLPPLMRTERPFQTMDLRGSKITRPSKPPEPPQGTERRMLGIHPAPPGARTTASIARPLADILVETEKPARGEDTLGGLGDALVRGNTLPPKDMRVNPEEQERAAAAETRYLRYGTTLYRVSEISGENWTEWLTDHALMRERVGKAVETLKGKRAENETYAADYQMLRAFSKEIADDARLNDYLLWIKTSEKKFAMMAQVYAELSMSPLTPYIEVLEGCEAKSGAGSDGGLRMFSAIVGDIREYEGTDYNYGELYKRMFDAWYVRKSAEAMVKVYENAGIANEREAALLRVGELIEEVGALRAENRRLEEAAKLKSVSPAVMEQVHEMRSAFLKYEGENNSLSAELSNERQKARDLQGRVDALQTESDAVKGEYRKQIEITNDLQAENERLNEEGEKSRGTINTLSEKLDGSSAEVANLRGELSKSEGANSLLMEKVRELVAKLDAYDNKMKDLEGRLATMEGYVRKVEAEKARLSEELALAKEPDLMQRPTMVSGTFEVPAGVMAAVPPVPGVAARDDSSITDLKALTGAAPKPAPGEAMLAGVDKEVGDALDAGFAAAAAGEPDVVVEERGKARRDRSGRDAATQVSLVPAAEAARMARVDDAPAPITAELPEEGIPAHVPEITQPIVDIERESREFEQAQEAVGLWGTKPGKAVKAIFAYGFAGKGQLPSMPVPRVIELPSISENTEVREKAQRELDEEKERFPKAMQEYNAWYNKLGRQLNTVRGKTIHAAEYIAKGYKKHERAVWIASGVVVGIAAVAVVSYLSLSGAPKQTDVQKQLSVQKPVAAQVASADVETGSAGGVKAAQGAKEVKQAPELAKPALAGVLSKHSLELSEGTHIVTFYKGLGGVTDVQERYVILAEALRSEVLLEKYEKKYIEGPVLEMYADFLKTAMAYAELEGQTDAERAGAKMLGETVSKRLDKRVQQKRIKEKIGKERASEMGELAGQFNEFAATVSVIQNDEREKPIEVPVVTAEELKKMEKAGEAPDTGVIILPDKAVDKPFDMGKEMSGVVGQEFEILDTPGEINKFSGMADKAEVLADKFLMQAHLTGQLVEHGLGSKMSEKRVLSMHIETMNTAIRFAMEDGQGMTAVAEAVNVFEMANTEAKRLIAYKGMQGELGQKRMENLNWMRKRAEELKAKVDAYGRNKGVAVPLPGSPAVDNLNGAPTAMPETVKLDRNNEYAALQTVVFSEHGLSILEHPLKVYQQMKGKKINNFDRFIILENLAEKVTGNPVWMDGLSKGEQFEMLRILASYLRATKMAANEPKNWRKGFKKDDILLNSIALEVSEIVTELRKLDKANVRPREKHLHFQMDQDTYEELGEALKAFGELLDYEYKQKRKMWE